MMDVKPLHNERDYDWAIREVSRYFESEPEPWHAPMAIVSRFYLTLIKAYEDEHFATQAWRSCRRSVFCDRIHGQVASGIGQA